MRWRPFDLLAGLSLGLCLATLVLWARSYYAEDHLGRVRRQLVGQQVIEHRWGLASHRGRMALIITADLEMPQAMYSQGIAERSAPTDRFGWHADTTSHLAWAYAEYDDTFPLGFAAEIHHGLSSTHVGIRLHGTFLSVPHWFLALFLALEPAARFLALTGRHTRSRARLALALSLLLAAAFLLCFPNLLWSVWPSIGIIFVPVLLMVVAVGVFLSGFLPTRAARRLAAGLCPICGYNLTANVSGVCPECGTPAPTK